MHEGDSLKQSVTRILAAADIADDRIDELANGLIAAVNQRMTEVMTDTDLPGRNEVVLGFIRGILQDSKVAAILR